MSCSLETERLLLRPPRAADISHFVPLLADFDVAKNLSRVPHPYTEDDACAFIVRAAHGWASGEDLSFAILRKVPDAYIGMCGIHPQRGWEMGYWIAKPLWRQGYASEAATRLVAFGFEELGAERLAAEWFHDNPVSGRVLERLGFQPSGETMSHCLARGHLVPSHIVALDRHAYKTRKNMP
ncbi:MAG TPA: GNAT family N-acetyltransferase [Micropepsaceae bacterium]|jgi:RimJ/RimL family protein N-acetyltransferase|nr:GNAT family N-acetyltransferase [Micropepsaceae bacterium]